MSHDVHSWIHWLRPPQLPPSLSIWTRTRALLVSKDRRHLFVTPWLQPFVQYLFLVRRGLAPDQAGPHPAGQPTQADPCWPPPLSQTARTEGRKSKHYFLKNVQYTHRLNMYLNLRSLCGLLCTAVLIAWDTATPPLPPHLASYIRGRYWSAKIDYISL